MSECLVAFFRVDLLAGWWYIAVFDLRTCPGVLPNFVFFTRGFVFHRLFFFFLFLSRAPLAGLFFFFCLDIFYSLVVASGGGAQNRRPAAANPIGGVPVWYFFPPLLGIPDCFWLALYRFLIFFVPWGAFWGTILLSLLFSIFFDFYCAYVFVVFFDDLLAWLVLFYFCLVFSDVPLFSSCVLFLWVFFFGRFIILASSQPRGSNSSFHARCWRMRVLSH